jgi:ABC-type glycerol-3-phosphate transport system permease component
VVLIEILGRWADYFWSLPIWLRSTMLIFAGLALTLAATRKFQDETTMALAYLAVAVVLFWTALLGFADWLPG